MNPNLLYSAAAAFFAAALTVVPAAPQPAGPAGGFRHPPMQPYRNRDGSFIRLRGTITTSSWSGCAATAAAP